MILEVADWLIFEARFSVEHVETMTPSRILFYVDRLIKFQEGRKR